MALTFNTGMNLLANGDSLAPTTPVAGDWVGVQINSTNTNVLLTDPTLDNDLFVEGSGSVAIRRGRDNSEGGMGFLTDAAINLTTTGNEVVGIWAQCTTPTFLNTQDAAGTSNATRPGISVYVSSSTNTGTTLLTDINFYSVGGSDNPTSGWKFYLIDTRQTPSRTIGNCDLTAVRNIGICIGYPNIPRNPRSDNLFIDAIYYGRPQYQVIGDGTEVAAMADFAAHSSNSTDGSNGLIERIGSSYFLNCGLKFGSSTQTATTTFSDATSPTIVQRRQQYYSQASSSFVEALRYQDYFNIEGEEAGSFPTSVTFGSVVGTGDDRQGVLGGTLSNENLANMRYAVDMSAITTANFYGVDIKNAKDGVSFEGGQNLIGTQLINCGPLNTGTSSNGATFINSFVIDPQSQDGSNIGINIENTSSGGSLPTNLKNVGFITSGTPTTQRYVGFNEAADFSVDFNDLIYYGDFSSATLYHGQNAGTNSDITINSNGGTNVLASEFENLNNATTTVISTKTLTIDNIEADTELRIYSYTDLADPNTYTELAGIERVGTTTAGDSGFTTPVLADGVYSTTYSYNTAGGNIPIVLVAHNLDFEFFRETLTLDASENTSFNVFQIPDRQYDAGSV